MATVEPPKLPPMPHRTREIFRVVYVFRQKYQHPTYDAAFWDCCCKEMMAISRHFGNDPFADALLMECYADIERELKGERIP